MAISVSRAMSKGVVMTVPVLVLTVSVAAVFLFFLLSSLSSCSCPSQPSATPVNNARNVDVGSSESSKANGFIATRKEDVEWVKNQIQANGIHMQENVLRKGINPRTRAQQLEDLKQPHFCWINSLIFNERDVMKGLLTVYDVQKKVRDVIFVTREGSRGKILPLWEERKLSIEDVRPFIIDMLQKTVLPPELLFHSQTHSTIPSICNFLNLFSFLRNSNLGDKFLPWVLDYPLFWTAIEKVYFMGEIAKLRKGNKWLDVLRCLGDFLDDKFGAKWVTLIQDDVLKAIYDKPNRVQKNITKNKNEHDKSNDVYIVPYKEDRAGIFRFFGATYSHINDCEYNKVRMYKRFYDEDIEQKLSRTFPFVYEYIKEGLLHLAHEKLVNPSEALEVVKRLSCMNRRQ